MLKAGLLPSPIITPLSSNQLAFKNKIDTQTFVEIRSDIADVRIYFTVDGSKPDPFQIFRTGSVSTFLYRGAFRLGPGKRVVRAIAVTQNGLRESNITTKYLDVNDRYSESQECSPDENSDHDQTLENNYAQNEFNRSAWADAFSDQPSIEGPMSAVSYAETQRNAWNPNDNYWLNPNQIPQQGYGREQIFERIPPPPQPPVLPPPAPVRLPAAPPIQPLPTRIVEVSYEEEKFWDRKMKPLSPGNGNWKKTLEHLFLNVYNFVRDEQQLRELFGWKVFGRIETMRLIDKGKTYQILTSFKKPLGEQSNQEDLPPQPVRKHSSKRRSKKRAQTPPDTEEEMSTRYSATRTSKATYSDDERSARPIPSLKPPVRQERSVHEENEAPKRTPRIYTEDIEEHGTLVPFEHFNVDRDCDDLRKAMKGAGTDNTVLIEILGNRSSDQRTKIVETYKAKLGRDLFDDIKGDTSGNFRDILINLLHARTKYDCLELQRSMKGIGTNEEALVEILASRTNRQLQDINRLYPTLFNRSLEDDIRNDTTGHFKKLLVALVQGQRSESNQINEETANNDAKELFEAGSKKWGTDESKFIEILCNRSNIQLKAVFDAYQQYSSRDIEADIKSETSGNLCTGLLTIVRIMRNRSGFFANQLKKALSGAGTNEDTLNRVIISRCEVDMIQIKEEYERFMKRSLEEHIHSDTSGNYRRILLELIKNPEQRIRRSETKESKRTTSDDSSDSEKPKSYREDTDQQGTMTAAKNFDAIRDADALRKAMDGLGTDEKTIINILGNRSAKQRQEIKSAYKIKHKRDLQADLKSETSGNFASLLERLVLDPVELDCLELKQAVKGAGTDEEALIEILTTRSSDRIKAINQAYVQMYSKPLEKDLKSDASGDFRILIVLLLQGRRPSVNKLDAHQTKQDARALADDSNEIFRTNEAIFNDLYRNRSNAQLKAIFDEYENMTGKPIADKVKSKTKGDHQKALLAIIRCIQSRPHFFAEQLNRAMKGLGTKESAINRIIVTRCEIDLISIKEAYKNLYKRDLERDISGDTSGDHKKLLLEILKDPSQRN